MWILNLVTLCYVKLHETLPVFLLARCTLQVLKVT